MPPKDPLRLAKEALDKALETERRNKAFLASIGPAIADTIKSLFKDLIQSSKVSVDEFKDALSKVKIEVKPDIKINPQIKIPEIRVPEAHVTVEIPEINIPEARVNVNVPDIVMPDEMNIKGWINVMGFDRGLLSNPLPVQLRDKDGKPVSLIENMTQVINAASGGGKHDYFTIKDIRSSSSSLIDQTENALRVTGNFATSGGQTFASDAVLSVNVIQHFGTDTAVNTGVANNGTLRVVQATDSVSSVHLATKLDKDNDSITAYIAADSNASVNLQQIAGTATAVNNGITNDGTLRVVHANDAIVSVNIVSGSSSGTEYTEGATNTGPTGVDMMIWDGASMYSARAGQGTSETALRVIQAADAIASVNIVSGSAAGTEYADAATASVPSGTLAMGDTGEESGNIFALATGSGVISSSVLRVVHVANAGISVSATQVTSPWVVSATDLDVRDLNVTQDEVLVHQVSGSIWSASVTNTVTVTGSLTSVVVVGPTVSDAADDGNAPIQFGGIARTANPTAVAANDVVKSTHDDLGRQLIRPVQVRDLILTAYVSITNGTETTLLAASAGSFHDLIYIMGANNSDAAVQVDIRPVTAGNIVMSLGIPASGTAGVALPVPFPQSASDTGNNWTIDMPDITGTTVAVSALFSREI